MKNVISRRTLINQALVAAAIVPALRMGTALAADAAPVDPSDPAAKSLGYAVDSSKVDAAANPTHKADQTCANCAQYKGNAGDAAGGCAIFPGKTVAAKGWCKVWAKKPAA